MPDKVRLAHDYLNGEGTGYFIVKMKSEGRDSTHVSKTVTDGNSKL